MAATKLGSFDELMEQASGEARPIAERLRRVVRAIHPATVETVRLGDRAATYGLGPRKMTDGYVYIQPHKQWVNLGFYRGALLSDPGGLLEGSGAKMRHVKVRSLADASKPALKKLVRAALQEREQALGSA